MVDSCLQKYYANLWLSYFNEKYTQPKPNFGWPKIASFIIQEIVEYHLQPFLCGEVYCPKTPSDAISNMVKQVLEVIESHRPQTPSAPGIYFETFVREIVARLLSKFSVQSITLKWAGKHDPKIVETQ